MLRISRKALEKKYNVGRLKEWRDHLTDDLGVDLQNQTTWDIDIDDIDTSTVSTFSTESLLNEFDNDSLDFDDLLEILI